MLHCNIKSSETLQLALDDLIADLRHSRRLGDLGRLALLAYCEVRRWARHAGHAELAEFSAEMMTGSPHTSREAFLDFIDRLLYELIRIQREFEPGTLMPKPTAVQAAALADIEPCSAEHWHPEVPDFFPTACSDA